MKILHISTRLILGGSQENTVLSCEGQARRGHEVHLAFGPIYGPEGSLLERVEKFRTADGRGITTHVVPHLVREVRAVSDRRAFDELYQLIKQLQPDIVHTHSSKAGVIGRAAAWAVRRDLPRSNDTPGVTPSEYALHGKGIVAQRGFNRYSPLYPAIVHTIHGPPFMPVEGSFVQRATTRAKNTMYTLAERHAAKRCHFIVSVADAMTRQFLDRGIGRADQYVTVRSGMEIEPYLHAKPGETREDVRRSLGFSESDFVIGTVARLAQHKGHDDLLDALAERMKREPHIKMLWVGDGWWRERLVERARTLGLKTCGPDAQIVLTGLVPPARIPAMMRAMDVLAHPSYREGLPRTVPQALLCGVCPVAYDCDGTGEVCRDMETGWLVPTGHVGKLREAIEWLMSHDAERRAMAERGKAMCVEMFSAEKMVDDLEAVYARAIELARTTRR